MAGSTIWRYKPLQPSGVFFTHDAGERYPVGNIFRLNFNVAPHAFYRYTMLAYCLMKDHYAARLHGSVAVMFDCRTGIFPDTEWHEGHRATIHPFGEEGLKYGALMRCRT